MDREIPKEERMKARRKSWMKIAGVVICVIAVFAVIFASLRKSVKMSDIKFSDVERSSIETSVSASGKVVPAFEEIINSPISTRIVEVYCQSGDSVLEGTPLLRLDLQSAETELNKLTDEMNMKRLAMEQTRLNIATYLRNLEMQIKVKEMSVNRLEAEVQNERRLDSLGSGTGDKVREAELAYNTGKLELQQLRQQLVNERQVKDAEYKSKQLELSIFEKNLGEQRRTLGNHLTTPVSSRPVPQLLPILIRRSVARSPKVRNWRWSATLPISVSMPRLPTATASVWQWVRRLT